MSLYSESGYEHIERRTHRAIKYALECARNRNKVRDYWGRLVRSDYELAAVDLSGRLKWTKALCDQFESLAEIKNDQFFFWFSCVDADCEEHPYKYVHFTPLESINKYRRGLRGLNYIAMLEPAIYASGSIKRPPAFKHLYPFKAFVSWHTHGLAWENDRKKLRLRFNEIEARHIYKPVVPNLKGCWAKFIETDLLGQKIGYMCKTPRLVSRIYCTNPDEIFEGNWTFNQKKARARPGEHIRYFKLLSKYTIDQFAFGGGEGTKILQQVKAPFIRRVNA